MEQVGEPFEITVPNLIFRTTIYRVKGEELFRLEFSDDRPPLVIAEVLMKNNSVWMSVPQGRQVEAEYFGKCIVEHLKER